MSEQLPTASAAEYGATAGAMLKRAREQHGMHIAMLASMMKVTPKKLEALEADRLHELPDLAFSRALTQAICRVLKVDAEPILAKLPALAKPEGLERASNGLAAPFREHGDSHTDAERWGLLKRPAFWATLAVLLGAAGMAFAPKAWMQRLTSVGVGAPATTSASQTPTTGSSRAPAAPPPSDKAVLLTTPIVVGGAVEVKKQSATGPERPEPTSTPVLVETVHSAPAPTAPAATAVAATSLPNTPPPNAAADGVIVVRTKGEAWVEVVDGRGRSMISRSLQAGETVGINGDPPFRVRLGSVANTELRYRGERVDVTSGSVGNTIRLELK